MEPFERAVAVVDPGGGDIPVRQAAAVAGAAGRVHVVAIADIAAAAQAGFVAVHAATQIRDEAARALRHAVQGHAVASEHVLAGRPVASVLARIRDSEATLLAVGASTPRRAAGVLLGDVASTLLRDAPCSMLLARAPTEEWPGRILVGVDGSPQGYAALRIARRLASRLAASLVVLIATGGKRVDAARLRDTHPDATFDERSPVAALQDHSRDAGLIVVGSRGLHGFRAVGSVSERVAHRAHCAVLVTRGLSLGNGGGYG